MEPLTDRQQAVLDFIREAIALEGFPPTLREIGSHLGIRSTNGVNDHLRALIRKGYLIRKDMKSRALTLSSAPPQASLSPEPNDIRHFELIPVVGQVSAHGSADNDFQNHDTVEIDRVQLTGEKEMFGLKIKGNSMAEAGLNDGDYVFVRKQIDAKPGEIVVTCVEGETSCRFFFPETHQIRLEAANSTLKPIEIPRHAWRSTMLIGVVTAMYRRLI